MHEARARRERSSRSTGQPWPCQPWAWSTILINFPELQIPR